MVKNSNILCPFNEPCVHNEKPAVQIFQLHHALEPESGKAERNPTVDHCSCADDERKFGQVFEC